MFQSRQRVGTRKLILFAVFGFALGLACGYVFMGTVHAVRVLCFCCKLLRLMPQAFLCRLIINFLIADVASGRTSAAEAWTASPR